jgi:hypothetical protein
MLQQVQRVSDQGIHQRGPGRLVIPGDLRLTRIGIVMRGAPRRRHLRRTRHLPDHPADRGDQLGDGVLGGHRVIEHHRIQRPPLLTRQHPRGRHHLPDPGKQPVRILRTRQPPPEIGQQRRIERAIQQPQPARGLPPQITPQHLNRLEVRHAMQGLQHHRHRQHLRRQARPPIRRGIHIREHPRREQRLPVLSKERKHAPRRD